MNTVNENQGQLSVIGIAKANDHLQAVELREENGSLNILWLKSSNAGDINWKAFAAECGISIEPQVHDKLEDDKNIVVGFDSAGTAFYSVTTPVVEEKEIEAIVQLQAESRLPLSIEQMELAWLSRKIKNQQMAITIAAARRQNIQDFINNVRDFRPTQIILDSEGVIQAWKTFFSHKERSAIIISAGAHNTNVCLTENGQLCNAVVLDLGIEEFSSEEFDEVTERFVQDMRSVVELFDHELSTQLPVIILSDGSETYDNMVSILKSEGLNATISLPESTFFTSSSQLDNKQIYEYRTAIGLASMAFKTDIPKLNLFEHLYNPFDKDKKQHWLYSPKVVYSITAVMIALFVVVSFAIDVAKPGIIQNKLDEFNAADDIEVLIEQRTLKQTIAKNRPDLLELLNEINTAGLGDQDNSANNTTTDGGNMGGRGGRGGRGGFGGGGASSRNTGGIQLDSFHFKKGSSVTITGRATSSDQLDRFEEKLEESNILSNVSNTISRTTSTQATAGGSRAGARGGRGGSGDNSGITFTMMFEYRNFSNNN